MKLTLSQQELEQAVRGYVNGMINLTAGTDMTIEFTAGRGANGITAEVDISYLAVTSIQEIAAPAQVQPIPAAPAPVKKPTVAEVTAAAIKTATAGPADTEKLADKPETPTRNTTGKSLFGTTDKINPKAEPANDVGQPADAPAPAAEGRKTLFGS